MCCDDHPQLTALSLRFDSTSSLLSFATALLSGSPAVKAKLHAELDATMPVDPSAFTQDTVRDARTQAPDYASTPSPAQVSTLRYTRAVLDETLRLYPVAYTTARTTVSPVTLSTGVTIPANIHVSIPIAFVHRDPKNWPDEPGSLPTLCLDGFDVFLFKFLTPIAILVPVSRHRCIQARTLLCLRFRGCCWKARRVPCRCIHPGERFCRICLLCPTDCGESCSSMPLPSLPPPLFFPSFVCPSQFALGRRDCVGKNFAMQEAVPLLALLHQRYEFTTAAGWELKSTIRGFSQVLEGGLPVTVKRRQ